MLWRGVSLNNAGLEALLAGEINTARRPILEARALCEAAQNIHARLAAAFMLGETYAWQDEFDWRQRPNRGYRLILPPLITL